MGTVKCKCHGCSKNSNEGFTIDIDTLNNRELWPNLKGQKFDLCPHCCIYLYTTLNRLNKNEPKNVD